MAINLINATLRPKQLSHKKTNKQFHSEEARYLIIRLPNSDFIKMCFLVLALTSFLLIIKRPSLFNVQRISAVSTSNNHHQQQQHYSSDSEQLLSILFRDLTNEGLLKKQKAVFLNNEEPFNFLTDHYNMDFIPLNDIEKQNSLSDDAVDFIFTSDFPTASTFIERVLKTGGIVTVLLNDNNVHPSTTSFYKPPNYKFVYMRRFGSVAVAMKKTSTPAVADDNNKPILTAAPRKLCGYASEAKKAALKNLEDVLLEPPRAASGKSRQYLKRTRYLPDLMGDSLESYPRRVFIEVVLPEKNGGSGTDWFPKNYPTRNKDFEMYKIETATEESSGKEVAPRIGMSDWLRKNVKDEEYVVMKAEAEVVQEMMRGNSIGLVDELFLECKPNKKGNKSRRAYWECLALYGMLRDKGVAVHQWWG